MTYTFKLARRLARFRLFGFATLATLASCNSTDALDPTGSSTPAGTETAIPTGTELVTASFAGGIPMGFFAQPTSAYGDRYNGGIVNAGASALLSTLAEVKSKGGKGVLMMVGSPKYYVNADGTFSLTKWKSLIDRYRSVDFTSYIKDGTIVGTLLIDEPNDPTNWAGHPISPAVVDEMARYSKAYWPTLPTLARVEPSYFPGKMTYLDGAWSQFVERKGPVGDYIKKAVSDAQARGLSLVVGLNTYKGGSPDLSPLTASEVKAYGTTLMSSSYPCAFINWKYDTYYLAGAGIGAAMDSLRSLAERHAARSCSASGASQTPPPPPDTTTTPPPPPPPANALPVSLFQAPASQSTSGWTGSAYRAEPTDLMTRLGQSKTAGVKVVVNLAWPSRVRNTDGTFNLTKWKAQVDRFRTLSLGQYLTGQTLYAHLLVEQPNCAACWGGHAIPWETVEAMAKYSKAIWPALPTVAKVAPTLLANAAFRWAYLDAGWATYNTRQGDFRTFVANQANAAKAEGLGLMLGLNLIDAGGANTAEMTASQILQLGTVAAKEPSACALIGWRYDAGYIGQSGIRAALDSVVKVAKSRPAASCVVN